MEKIKRTVMGIPVKIYTIMLLAVLLIDAIALDFEPTLQKIEFCDVADAYNSLIALCPSITLFAKDYRGVFITVTVIVLGLFLFRLIYRPKMMLIKQTSYSPDIAEVDPAFLHKYYVKTVAINQCLEMKNIDQMKDALSRQDNVVASVKLSRNSAKLCYYGIAHTPLIFRLGFMIGDENSVMLLHKQRANDALFLEWSNKKDYSTIISKESNKSVSSDELIVSVATSIKIEERDLQSLKPSDKHILKFESSNLSFDCITSYNLAETFRNAIMIELRACVKKYGIQRIHLVLSSSVAFTFFLGQAFSAQHEPKIIVYHFQNGVYPWGICINESPSNGLVING